jgi:AAA15 family ATPase/GTPase
MENAFNNIEIKNFKSIKYLKTDCKRVNVFIGKPNVGKSNVLEALSLLGANYSLSHEKYLSEFIRYEEITNLFNDDDLLNKIEVNTDKGCAVMRFHANAINQADLIIGQGKWFKILEDFNNYHNLGEIRDQFIGLDKSDSIFVPPSYKIINTNGRISIDDYYNTSPVKSYKYSENSTFPNKFSGFLLPPNGENLFSIIDQNKALRKEIVEIFAEYNLQFVAYKKESKFEIEKNIDGYINKYHYSSIADTFKRLIFYFAAIDSNKNSVLILEEPEVHSFPPYTKDLSNRIIDTKDNQFFITTHSPYLLQNLISNLDNTELNVFITYFEDYQTKIKPLSDEDLRKASEFSVDLFYNLDQFVTNA